MEITDVPFNRFVGLKRSGRPGAGSLELEDSPNYNNHLGTVHASAQFALAEACSGEYLLSRFEELAADHVPVVRRAEVKFRKPASGKLVAEARVADEKLRKFVADLEAKGRAVVGINVEVRDSTGGVTMRAAIDWFIQRMRPT